MAELEELTKKRAEGAGLGAGAALPSAAPLKKYERVLTLSGKVNVVYLPFELTHLDYLRRVLDTIKLCIGWDWLPGGQAGET